MERFPGNKMETLRLMGGIYEAAYRYGLRYQVSGRLVQAFKC
jgi:hypothetical protein